MSPTTRLRPIFWSGATTWYGKRSRELCAILPGFYIYLLKEKITPPDGFETSRKRQARAEAAREREELHNRQRSIELAYDDYRQKAIDDYIAAHYTGTQIEELIRAKAAGRRQQHKQLPSDTIIQIAYRDVRAEIAERIPVISLEEFSKRTE